MCTPEFAEQIKRLKLYVSLYIFNVIYNTYASILSIISQHFYNSALLHTLTRNYDILSFCFIKQIIQFILI